MRRGAIGSENVTGSCSRVSCISSDVPGRLAGARAPDSAGEISSATTRPPRPAEREEHFATALDDSAQTYGIAVRGASGFCRRDVRECEGLLGERGEGDLGGGS